MNIDVVYQNYDAFHAMCLATTFLCSYGCRQFHEDAQKITGFIGKAFGLPQKTIDSFERCILGDMMTIGLIADYQALASTELLSDKDKENIELYEMKGHILEEIAVAEAQNYHAADINTYNRIHGNMKYEYFHHPYHPQYRFWQLSQLLKAGNVSIARQVGLMYALGIGCQADTRKAEECLKKSLLWGDRVSALLLDGLHQTPEYGTIFSDEEISTEADQYRQYIQLINACIITPKKDPLINHRLAEVLISGELSHQHKLSLILNYNDNTWRNASGLLSHSANPIGFRVRNNE